MILDDYSGPLVKALDTNSTNNADAKYDPQATEPNDDGDFELGIRTGIAAPMLLIMPYANSADNGVFTMRLWGWRRIGKGAHELLWVPQMLVEVTCTASAKVGLASRLVTADERFTDLLVVANGSVGPGGEVNSPGNDLIGHLKVNLRGCQKFRFWFRGDGAQVVSMNALCAKAS